MFTGIVREVGTVEGVQGDGERRRLLVRAPATAAVVAVGDSVALDGVCLTAVALADGVLAFDAVPETLARSTVSRLSPGRRVNVEPALRAGDPLGGHFVQGHVDGVASVQAVEREGEGRRLVVELPSELARYAVEKGSLALQGVSVTIAAVAGDSVQVALVPHTLAATTLGSLRPGDDVNVEVDVLAKQVERLLEARGHTA
ncbi:MAG: riboflavin synthase [Thermoleophilia bacterium]|nr:riboflavin synthase [Thermoleophilia bacterium]